MWQTRITIIIPTSFSIISYSAIMILIDDDDDDDDDNDTIFTQQMMSNARFFRTLVLLWRRAQPEHNNLKHSRQRLCATLRRTPKTSPSPCEWLQISHNFRPPSLPSSKTPPTPIANFRRCSMTSLSRATMGSSGRRRTPPGGSTESVAQAGHVMWWRSPEVATIS